MRSHACLKLLAEPRHNLPSEISSFIGREEEVEQLLGMLARTRLLTLVGTGGVGKTRLALRVAMEVRDVYPEGVWLVELASLRNPALMPETVAAVLAVREQPDHPLVSTLLTYLAPKRMLLVLDNCEHLLDNCAALTETLLRGCPHLQILTTSRQALGIAGETTWWVPSLSAPKSAAEPLERLTQYEAVRLFLERATSTRPHFSITTDNASAVVDLCRRLDGIPLAIELAAARVSVLPVEQIAGRLDDRFRLLTGGSRTAPARHQTLHSALEWSYELLSDPERVLFQRLSVFAGGWTLEAAEAVCAGGCLAPEEVLELLGHLVDRSMVVAEAGQRPVARYRLLETLRQYARDRLANTGEADATMRQYTDYFLALAEQAFPHLRGGPDLASWLQLLEHEQDNLRAVLRWCVERGEVDRALQLGGAVWRFWFLRGSPTEGRDWLEALLRLVRGPQFRRTPIRARALNGAGVLASQQADYAAAQALQEESLAISCELDDQRSIGSSLNNLGMVALHRGDHVNARTLLEQALGIARKEGDSVRVGIGLSNLAGLFVIRGDYAAARAHHAESLTLARELGDKTHIAEEQSRLGVAVLAQGDVAAARALCESSLALAREVGDAVVIGWSCFDLALVRAQEKNWAGARALYEESLRLRAREDQRRLPLCLAGLAGVAAWEGNPERAFRMFGAATALLDARAADEVAWACSPFDSAIVERWQTAARAALGKEAAAAAYAAGSALSPEEVLTEALAADEPPASARQMRAGGLTEREIDVVRLLATGMTNRDIAQALVIVPSTAERHVANILNKLSLQTRGQVAVWAVTHGVGSGPIVSAT